MKNSFKIPQLLLRLALGIGFLTTVSDRLGLLPADTRNIEWGAWDKFIDYTKFLPYIIVEPETILITIYHETKPAIRLHKNIHDMKTRLSLKNLKLNLQ